MRSIAVRLKDGVDLKQELIRLGGDYDIPAGVILSGVGGLKKAHVRFPSTPDAVRSREAEADLEIVSLTGTVSKAGIHVHMSFANEDGTTFGGHLMNGCIVRNTVELVVGLLDGLQFTRAVNPQSGYEELVISPTGNVTLSHLPGDGTGIQG